MLGIIDFVRRNMKINSPPEAPKSSKPYRFGILGAARIAPNALIKPAQSHPDVLVVAVASRDKAKGESFAKGHRIPVVFSGQNAYQELLDSTSVDVVYNALPNGMHYEYTMKALRAGKHVLVEKPCASTAEEARKIFEYAESRGLVVMEGYHYKFYPAMHRVKEIVDSNELGNVQSIHSELAVPQGQVLLKDDIRWRFDLSGGATMDMGVYTLSAARYIASSDPIEVEVATAIGTTDDPERVDRAMTATLSMPRSITSTSLVDFGLPPRGPFGLFPQMPKNSLKVVCEKGEIYYYGMVLAHHYHYVQVKFGNGQKRTEKFYKFSNGLGEEWWSTYRYQLEAFVKKLSGEQPHEWNTPEDSISQMEWIEKIYLKAGLPVRPSSLN